MLDIYTYAAIFVLEMNEVCYSLIAVAMLICSGEYYYHAIREVLVIFAALTCNKLL